MNKNKHFKFNIAHFVLPIAVIAAIFSIAKTALAGDFANPDSKFAFCENVGWMNASTTAERLTVSAAGVTGFMWGENIGWIKFDYDGIAGATNTTATDWGVVNDGAGNLSGYAWGENIGWINFNPTHSQVTIDACTGKFSGWAWGENIGWIDFGHAATDYVMDYEGHGSRLPVTAENHSLGSQVTNQWVSIGDNITSVHYRYRLDPDGTTVGISTTTVNMTSLSGVINSDITSAKLYRDANSDGAVTSEMLIADGAVSLAGSSGSVTFASSTYQISAATDFLIELTVTNLEAGGGGGEDVATFVIEGTVMFEGSFNFEGQAWAGGGAGDTMTIQWGSAESNSCDIEISGSPSDITHTKQ